MATTFMFTTGNGMDPADAGQLRRSFVRLRYAPGAGGVNDGQPSLAVADYWGAFSDFQRTDEDQDLGSAGVVLVPDHGNAYRWRQGRHSVHLDRNNLGHDTWEPQFNLPFVGTYLPNAPNRQAGLPTTTTADQTGRSSHA